MTDFIQEVDDDLRHDRYRRLWDRYGKYAVAAAVLLVLAVAGTVAYRDWQKTRRAEDTRRLAESVRLAQSDPKLAPDALSSLARSTGGGVGSLARFYAAASLAQQGDVTRAVEIYDSLAADASTDQAFRDLAVLLAAQHRAEDMAQQHNTDESAERGLAFLVGRRISDPGQCQRDDAAGADPGDEAHRGQCAERSGVGRADRSRGGDEAGNGDDLELADAVAQRSMHELK